LISELKKIHEIEQATPDYLAFHTAVPNDPMYPSQWGHNNTSQMLSWSSNTYEHTGAAVGTYGFDTNAEIGWYGTQPYGDSNVIIAIIDSGVDADHPDLNQVTGYDFGDADNDPDDDSAEPGHGTACSGVAAAIANNNLGVAGIAGGCSIMPLKVADNDGNMAFSSIDNAIYYAADNGADIISLSLGASVDPSQVPSTETALSYALSAGVTIFAATANANNYTIDYPSNSQYVISVGAASPCDGRKRSSSNSGEVNPGNSTDPNGVTCDNEIWWGSNYGVNTQDARDAVDIIAPTILPTTDIGGSGGYNTNAGSAGDYSMWFNGTSCATPYAAGVAALIKSKYPTWTPAQIRAQIVNTAIDIVNVESSVGWDKYSGYGLVDVGAAIGPEGYPLCTITNPSPSEVIERGTIETITVSASDPGGSLNNVKIYIDDILQITLLSSPYEYSWETEFESLTNHTIKATATDNDLNETDDVIVVRIANPQENLFTDDFETNKGWTLSGEFERGAPGGLGGDHGNPDPGSAYAGSNVLGVDLTGLDNYSGDYETSLADRAYKAESPAIDCSDYNNITLSFFRWLNVEQPAYDHAYIDINNGTGWQQIWTNTAGIEDAAWSQQNFDISTYANEQAMVQIRFCMGGSDTSWQYSGWNIDDLIVSGESTIIPGYGGSSNQGDPTQPVIVDIDPIDIGGIPIDPDVSIDPEGSVGLTVDVTVSEDVQSGAPVPNPEAVQISYNISIIGNITGLTVDFDLCFDGLTGLSSILWYNGSTWLVPDNIQWENPAGHVTFSITFPSSRGSRDGSTEIILGDDNPLPVTLSSLQASFINDHAVLQWITQSETQNAGWNVYRAESSNSEQRLKI
ncbi:MAG: hypothetical protein DRP70_17225, partial [Spirochaetes bacterium]